MLQSPSFNVSVIISIHTACTMKSILQTNTTLNTHLYQIAILKKSAIIRTPTLRQYILATGLI